MRKRVGIVIIFLFYSINLAAQVSDIEQITEVLVRPDYKTKIQCMAPEGCPPSVGILLHSTAILSNKQGVINIVPGICTGFLIEKDIIATAGHCIPKELQSKEPIKCDNKMKFVLPDGTSSGCDQILGQNIYPRDFAFIKLKEPITHVAPLSIDDNGIGDENEINVFAAELVAQNTEEFTLDFQLKKKTCTTYSSAWVRPSPTGYTTDISYKQCSEPIVHGNSGAPTFSQGKVLGIVVSFLDLNRTDPLLPSAKKVLSYKDAVIGQSTSFRCLDFRNYKESDDLLCQNRTALQFSKDRAEGMAALQAQKITELRRKLKEYRESAVFDYEEIVANLDPRFRWKFKIIEERSETSDYQGLFLVPECLRKFSFKPIITTARIPYFSIHYGYNRMLIHDSEYETGMVETEFQVFQTLYGYWAVLGINSKFNHHVQPIGLCR